MKSTISKILGVAVTLAILASLMVTGTALPASAAVGTVAYGSVNTPSGLSNFFTAGVNKDFLVSTADGTTMFSFDNTTGVLYKSVNGGFTWTTRTAGTLGLPALSVLVAMDISPSYATDSTIVAAEAGKIWISTDGGNNFYEVATSDLTVKREGGAITSLDMGAYYATGKMNILIGCLGTGDVYSNVLRFDITQAYGTWTEVGGLRVGGTPAGIGNYNAVGVLFSPVNTSDSEIIVVADVGGVATLYSSFANANFGNACAIATSAITSAVIAVGTDYNGLSTNTLAIGLAGGAAPDIYRVSGRTSAGPGAASDRNALGAGIANIKSIAINGPIATANVLVGVYGTSNVYRCSTFTGTTTTFLPATKAPTGAAAGNTSVVWAGANAVAATTGADSAISVSTDGAVNFNQTGLIDVGTIGAMSLANAGTYFAAADASNLFLVMANTTGGAYALRHLYVTSDGGTTWKRVMVSSATQTIAYVVPSPAYATDKTIFVSQGPAATTVLIFKSTDNGNSFSGAIASDFQSAITAVDGTNYYYGGVTTPSFYKYGRFVSGTFPTTATGNVVSIAFNPKDTTKATIAVGMSTGAVYESTNDGVSFTRKGVAGPGAGPVKVSYAPDGSLYAATGTVVARYDAVNSATGWLTIQAAVAATGVAVGSDGTLYASDSAAGAGIFRSLYPTAATALLNLCEFQALSSANFASYAGTYQAQSLAIVSTAADNTLYVLENTTAASATGINYVGRIYGFKDTLITAPTLSSPADKAVLTTTTTAAPAWAAYTNATLYEIQFDVYSTFVTAGTASGTGTTATLNGLTPGTTYYWRVRAKSVQVALAPAVNLNSRWATVRSFITALTQPVVNVVQDPTQGATNVPVDTTFTWPVVAGAGVTYEFVIAEELGNADKFSIIDYSATTTTNAHKLREDLKYNTQYWWRVRAVTATSKSDWTTSFFTTAKEPVVTTAVTPTVTTVVVTQPPATTITFTNPPVEKVQAIPSYLIWAVIAVGAVLIIAVIVLIVRTRRIS